MAAIDFPNSPLVNDQFTAAGKTWVWNGSVWNSVDTLIEGHKIYDSSGVLMTQQSKLKFTRLSVSNDGGNGQTVVTRPADTFAGTTAPTSPVVGDVWTNTNTWKTYKYYDSFWVEYGVVNSSIRARRHDFVSSYSYCGTAPYGSSESSAVWKIVRILVASNGSVTSTATALNVTWTGRLTHTYT